MDTSKFVFGTYRVKGKVLKDSICQAMHVFSENNYELLLDSATSYINIDILMEVINEYPNVKSDGK